MSLKNINIAICDDEVSSIYSIKKYLISYQIQFDIDCEIHTFTDSSKFLSSFETNKYNIVFLDIDMPNMDGLEISKHIRKKYSDDVYIVFVTSYPSYMHDSFQVHPFQYLIKPVSYNIFQNIMSDLLTYMQSKNNIRIVVDTYNEKLLVNVNDVIYIRTSKSQKLHLIYTLRDSQISGRGALSSLATSLAEHGFILTNQSTLVNTKHITHFNDKLLGLDNGDVINISRRNLKKFRTFFAKQIISDMKG